MSNGTSERSKYQVQCEAHMAHVKSHPEWIRKANEALKAWENGDKTLQHAIAVALQAAYEAGTRGEYPEVPVANTERPTRMVRSRPETVVQTTLQVRIQRGRLARMKQ